MNAKKNSQAPDSALFGAERTQPSSRISRTTVPVSVIKESVTELLYELEFGKQSKRTIEGKKDIFEKFCWWLDREGLERFGRVEIKRFLHYLANAHENPMGQRVP